MHTYIHICVQHIHCSHVKLWGKTWNNMFVWLTSQINSIWLFPIMNYKGCSRMLGCWLSLHKALGSFSFWGCCEDGSGIDLGLLHTEFLAWNLWKALSLCFGSAILVLRHTVWHLATPHTPHLCFEIYIWKCRSYLNQCC